MRKISAFNSFLVFASGTLLLFAGTKYLIPYLHLITGWETIIFWFLVAGIGVFTPLLLISFFMLKNEKVFAQPGWWQNRLRFKKMSKSDWLWAIGGILVIGAASALIMKITELVSGPFDSQPPFMAFDPLGPGRYYILLLWLPYWLLNIFGEEILWRGVLLPRMELAHGKFTWLIHGTFWGMFHLPFGWGLLLTLLPILYIQSYIVQKRKNTWIGVIIHAVINGPSFIAISFGLI